MKRKKKLAAGTIAAVLAASCVVCAYDGVQIYVNQEPVQAEAILYNDMTYVPLRAVGEALGATVSWDQNTKSAYVDMSEEDIVPNVIASVSDSVVAIAGNYKPDRVPDQVLAYNGAYAFGTGVVIKSGGMILTNAHVVNGIDNLTVIFKNGESYPATVQYMDETADLAVVKINKLGLKPISFADESDLVVGKTVIAIGTPLSLTMRNTATKGMISGKDVAVNGEYFAYLQSDAATNSGNSGGPLVNLEGKLVGINTLGVQYADGISLAIPVDTVKYVLNQFEQYGAVRYPDLGAAFEQPWEAKIGLPTTKGLNVVSGAGELQAGDMVTKINGIEVHSFTELHEALKDTYQSGSITVTRIRNGEQSDVSITPSFS